MVDSVSVAVGCEVAAGVTDLLVVSQAGGEGQQPERDAGTDAGQGAGAITELVPAGELVRTMVSQAEKIIERLAALRP